MPFIKTIPYVESEGKLRKLYDRVKGPNDNVDNVLSIHSLRPHTLTGHMTLYKAVLHNTENTLPKWYLELIGVYVSQLNNCDYCVQHHSAGLKRLLNDDTKYDACIRALNPAYFANDSELTASEKKGLLHAKKLTLAHHTIQSEDIDELRDSGLTDGEILEINQVASYFNYVNRMVVGLGVDTAGDIIGLSPNESTDPDNWNHQ